MKTVIYIENEERTCHLNALALRQIRKTHPEDMLVMISAGDFSANGTLLQPSGKLRADAYRNAGADLVLSLPVASVLGGYGKKEFAAMALIQRLHAGDQLILFGTPLKGQTLEELEEQLRSYAMFLFQEKGDYRRILTGYLNQGLALRKAQRETLCACIPDAAAVLSNPINLHALWMLDAMLQLYYMPKVEFQAAVEMEEEEETAKSGLQEGGFSFDQMATKELQRILRAASMEDLIDISGSTTQMVDALLKQKEKALGAESLEAVTALLQPAPADLARLFLLKTILGIRKIYMQICGLHTFVPYCDVLSENPGNREALTQLEENSWVPFVREMDPPLEETGNYYYLLQADQKARELLAKE